MSNSFINFQVFTDSWKSINDFLKMLSVFPDDTSAFEQKYGLFKYPMQVNEFIRSCNILKEQLELLGGATKLKKEIANNSSYLEHFSPPDGAIYDSIVWLAGQVSGIAVTFISVFNNLRSTLDPSSGSNDQRAKLLTDILCGAFGLSTKTDTLTTYALSLGSKILPIQQKNISAFMVISDTKLLADANENIGSLIAQNKNKRSRIDELKASWNPIGKKNREKEIDSLEQQVQNNAIEINNKTTFTSDLNTQVMLTGNKLSTSVQAINFNLGNIQHFFSGITEQFHSFSKISSVDQLSNYDWVAKTLDIPNTLAAWNETKNAADTFIQNSMID